MRNILLAIIVAALPASVAATEPSSILKPDKPAASDRLLPMKGTSAGNSCAAFGPGFVKLAGSANRASPLQLDIIVPVVMGCAMLWWVSRGMSWTRRLVATAITLVVIICILLFERSGF
jgi:hypothetical protein